MSDLSSSRQAILLRLKKRGPQSVRALAGHLGMTTMGVRQHLNALQTESYVTQSEWLTPSKARGRPVRPWHLTSKGHARFPDTHAAVTVDLITSVRDTFGESGMAAMVQHWAEQQWARYRVALSESVASSGVAGLRERLKALARLRSEDGYLCEVKLLGGSSGERWLLIENHCPILAAATACPGYCGAELALFRSVLKSGNETDPEVTVERMNHMLMGARRCAYRVTLVEDGA